MHTCVTLAQCAADARMPGPSPATAKLPILQLNTRGVDPDSNSPKIRHARWRAAARNRTTDPSTTGHYYWPTTLPPALPAAPCAVERKRTPETKETSPINACARLSAAAPVPGHVIRVYAPAWVQQPWRLCQGRAWGTAEASVAAVLGGRATVLLTTASSRSCACRARRPP